MPEGVDLGDTGQKWDGRTYYGRPQLKPAPFNSALVGSYVFLAGLSGAAQLLATVTDLARGRAADGVVRRGRFLALLAPTFGTACLIADLHTPRRFYNMLRVFKPTSPMSFGSWMLVGFSAASGVTAAVQFVVDRVAWLGWLRGLARLTQVPAALTGAGLGTYTASLFSATSTPLWAAAPKSLAVRYGSASMATAAAALSLGERRSRIGRNLDALAVAALATELAATLAGEEQYRRAGMSSDGPQVHAAGSATLLPLGLLLTSLLFTRRRSRLLSTAASLATLAGALAMRINVMDAGNETAERPEISMRFAQPTTRPRPSDPGFRSADR
jgi:formate-dependent nitrite reductase membrane component NrfD